MNTTNVRYSFLFGITITTAIFALTACNAEVVGGGGQGGSGGSGGSGGNGGSTASTGGNGGGGTAGSNPGAPNAISMLYSELMSPPNPTGGTSVGSSGSGGGPGPDTLYIAIGSDGQLCNNPFNAEPCGNQWRVSFGIPAALQQVGVISLDDPSIIANFSMSGPNEPQPGQCSGGGGSFFEGTLEITAIDGNHVAGILANTTTFDFDANGAFDAVRCVF